jgi:hypothetical protein
MRKVENRGMETMKNITSSIYDFETLIEGGYLYVDKTAYLWNLVRRTGESYFLTRPRRFGKSLTISTLKAIFEGKRHLFEGLAIANTDYDWKSYPVLHLDMGSCMVRTANDLKNYLAKLLRDQARKHTIQLDEIDTNLISSSFEELINKTAGEGKAVILLDEYDKPLIDNLGAEETEAILEVLKGFYSAIKTCNSKERFVFITGVTKFSHVSMFSGFNNPDDISMRREYATMMGYTQGELEKYFAEYIDLACQQTGKSRAELLPEIKAWYDGYRFEEKSETVYNPVSIARFFENDFKFSNYWFSTGTSAFLKKLAQEKNPDIEKIIAKPSVGFAFNAFEIDNVDAKTLLLQSGYLTIKRCEEELGETLYYLDFPNREVKSSFEIYFLNAYTGIPEEDIGATVFAMQKALRSGNIELFMDQLKTFFANVKYDIGSNVEGRYQLLFYSVFVLLGVRIEGESMTNNGRIDAVIVTAKFVYIFEFKIDESAETAMGQIKQKEYYQKYKHAQKDIILIGANFSTKSRQLTDWKIETT